MMLPVLVDRGACVEAASRQNAEGAVKIWEDLDRYRRVIAATCPDVVVECGTWRGGSARWFAGEGPAVVTIDNVPCTVGPLPGVVTVVGDSVAPDTVDQIRELVSGLRVMIVLDADHSAAHVAAEIRAYGPMVSTGCYLVVEDGIVRWLPHQPYQGSPLDAIEELLAGSPGWRRDERIEALHPVSMHPAGWWTRTGEPWPTP